MDPLLPSDTVGHSLLDLDPVKLHRILTPTNGRDMLGAAEPPSGGAVCSSTPGNPGIPADTLLPPMDP
jgi:hypothetical protein